MLDDNNYHPGLLLHDCARLFRQCMSASVQDLGLSEATWRVLGSVHKFPGINQTQLAITLGIGKSPLGDLVDKLEAEKLLTRSLDSSDRRQNCLRVAEQGEGVSQQVRHRYAALEEQCFIGFSVKQRGQLCTGLRLVYRNLTALSADLPQGLQASDLTEILLIGAISRLNSRHFDQQLKQLGFTRSQWLVLDGIARREGIQQNNLAAQLNMRKPPVGALVAKLEAAGWVERRVAPDDRRARQLYLTPHCHRQLDSLNHIFADLHNHALEGVTETQRLQLRQQLLRFRANLQTIAGQQPSPRIETIP